MRKEYSKDSKILIGKVHDSQGLTYKVYEIFRFVRAITLSNDGKFKKCKSRFFLEDGREVSLQDDGRWLVLGTPEYLTGVRED